MKLTTAQRIIIHDMFNGHCAYCGETLVKGWHADHIEPVEREWWKAHRPKTTTKWDEKNKCIVQVDSDRRVTMGRPDRDCMENMFPACRACNIDKSSLPLEVWRKAMEDRVDVCRRNYSAYRHAERFGLVKQVETKVIFYFERLGA